MVPVHTVSRHEGEPAVVMKRVEGAAWSALLADPDAHRERLGSDPLAFHVRVLMRVANAISYAHSRHVLHLDLKPDNVMIGEYGEVYVLDWGLALGVGQESPAWISRAADVEGVAGTPAYMAPELAMGAGPAIDARTDVYLLGAMLHEVATGRVLHEGHAPLARLFSAYMSEPREYGPEVPKELARIVTKATAREPAARFQSVAELREALQAFLTHRDAELLFASAEEDLASLQARVAGPSEDTSGRDTSGRDTSRRDTSGRDTSAHDTSGHDASAHDAAHAASDASAVQAHFAGARFALREVAALWPEHPGLHAARRALYETMALWALDSGDPGVAEVHLGEVDDPSVELVARIAEAHADMEAKASRRAELEAMARDADVSTGLRFRALLAVFLAAVFLGVNLSMGALTRARVLTLTYTDMWLTGAATGGLLMAPIILWKRRVIFENRASTSLFATLITTFCVVQAHWALCMILSLPFASALALTPLYYGLAFAAISLLLYPRLSPAALLQAPTLLGAAAWPEHAYDIIGVGGAASVLYLALEWYRRWAEQAEGAR